MNPFSLNDRNYPPVNKQICFDKQTGKLDKQPTYQYVVITIAFLLKLYIILI